MTNDFKLYGRCYACRRNKLFVRKRTIDTPVGSAKSQFLMCTPCFKKLAKALK